MKITLPLYVDMRVADILKRHAESTHTTPSRLGAAILAEWAAKQSPDIKLTPELSLTKWEQIALAAMDGLTAAHAKMERENPRRGERIFPLNELVKQAGLYPSQALAGLRGLERKGVLKCLIAQRTADVARGWDDAPEVEHWCRVDRTQHAGNV